MNVRVIKLGGSLLDLPDWAAQLAHWLAAQEPLVNVLVVGGGGLVDALRTTGGIGQVDERVAHRLCLDAMGITAELASRLVPGALLRLYPTEIDRGGSSLQVLDVRRWLAEEPESALPHAWIVTSDSIAAHLANRLEAAELVLLKSTLPEAPGSAVGLAECGLVDAYFPRAWDQRPLRIVNLRDREFRELRL